MALQAADPQPASPAGRKNSQYESTIIDFVQKDQGRFIVVSDDQAFAGAMRSVLHKQLALSSSSILTIVADHAQILRCSKTRPTATYAADIYGAHSGRPGHDFHGQTAQNRPFPGC
jgi:hypothetical protein